MRKRRLTRKAKRNKSKKIIIISLVCFMFIMIGGYAAFQTNLNITAKGSIVDRSRVIQSWTSTSNEDFHTDYYRENIVSATFLDDARVPSNAVESWDVSETKDRGVMAYVVQNSEDNTKYDLYIGAGGGVIANEDSSYLFREFIGVTSINFNNNFDTSNTLSMHQMFYHCSNLETIDLSSFDTSNVTNMMDFISGGNKLTSLDLTSFDTSNVTNMYHMFSTYYREAQSGQTSTLTEILFGPKFDTSKVTNMADMFAGLPLKSLDLTNFDTSNVTNMYHMFYNCRNLITLNLCSFDTSKVTNMIGIFGYTSSVQNVYVGLNWIITNADTTQMFMNSNISEVTTGKC